MMHWSRVGTLEPDELAEDEVEEEVLLALLLVLEAELALDLEAEVLLLEEEELELVLLLEELLWEEELPKPQVVAARHLDKHTEPHVVRTLAWAI